MKFKPGTQIARPDQPSVLAGTIVACIQTANFEYYAIRWAFNGIDTNEEPAHALPGGPMHSLPWQGSELIDWFYVEVQDA